MSGVRRVTRARKRGELRSLAAPGGYAALVSVTARRASTS